VQAPSPIPRLTDIIEAIQHIRAETTGVPLDAFEADWRKRWLVERGVEIISEASRRLPDELRRVTRKFHGGTSPTSETSYATNISGSPPTCCGGWLKTTCRRWIAYAVRN